MKIDLRLMMMAAALALAACDQPRQGAGCVLTETGELTWSNGAAPDIVTAHAEGPACAQAVVTLVIRKANGDPLWAFASTYYDMAMGGAGPEGGPPVSEDQLGQFLKGWAQLNVQHTNELPPWAEGAASLGDAVEGFSYMTAFPREAYEEIRARALAMVCFAAAAESSDCLIIDPASGTPARIVSFGA